jgi:anthranilate synthase/aminodeoxychorismate synthase-like glutamine amidotransferase
MPVLLVDNYDSFTYNLFQMVQSQTEEPVVVYRNDAIGFDEVKSIRPSRIILSPGPGHPAVDSDFGVCKDIIQRLEELSVDGRVPSVLGVCLGHQGMAQHLGGNVVGAPEIIHGKTSEVSVEEPSALFDGLSNPFTAMRYHSLVVEEATLPEDFVITARESKHGLIMAMQHRSRPLYGVQFHPESIGTPEGQQLLRNFLTRC